MKKRTSKKSVLGLMAAIKTRRRHDLRVNIMPLDSHDYKFQTRFL